MYLAAQNLFVYLVILILIFLGAILNEWKAKYQKRAKGKDLMKSCGVMLRSVNNRHIGHSLGKCII